MSNVINVISSTIEQKVLNSCSAIIAAFFPGKIIENNCSEHNEVFCSTLEIERSIMQASTFEVRLRTEKENVFYQQIKSEKPEILDELSLPGKEPLFQILVKRAIFLFLTKYTGEIIPWGILTGIRPGKLVLRMENLGLIKEIQMKILTDLYLVAEEKAELLQTITEIQRPYLLHNKERSDLVSVYLTIPFCPSRCFYCSFPSMQLPASPKSKKVLQKYLAALYSEVELTGEILKELGLKAESIYIGGGTPTILEATELEMLLKVIQTNILTDDQVEYTVEAGRPDTLDYKKLAVLKKYQVNRLSINPQSMQEQTLRRIGRNHQASDIIECYGLARELSDWVINMDLILGLPGEELPEIRNSVEKVLGLRPDNLTVHALALKRGSIAWENNYVHSVKQDWVGIQHQVEQQIRTSGYKPYYLYRQKYIVGNLENVGYALPGRVCRYNIAIIEEQQNIIGLGAGAASKILKRDSGHVNIYNPIGIDHYSAGFGEVHLKRKRLLQEEYGLLTKKS